MRYVIGILAGIAVAWLAFLALLAVVRPKGTDLREAARLVPDLARLLKRMATAPDAPRSLRIRLALLAAYLAFPIDLVPDFIPVLGYADDVIVIAVVLRSVVRRAGPDALDRHWQGTPAGLAVVRHLAGMSP